MDLDGDGKLDVLSGSWPGELFLFRGNGKGFNEPEMIKDKRGEIINIGGGIRKESSSNYGILIAGHATFGEKNGKKIVKYHGKEIEYDEEKGAAITGTASAAHACDWDGDLDLLVGDIRGNVHLVPNEGKRNAYAFGKETTLTTISGGDAGPFACDWDGDGKLDLLVGCGDGSVQFYRNVGDKKAPKLGKAVALLPACKAEYGKGAPAEPRRGTRSKVWAADWNGDGRLDLLVGDFTTQRPPPKDLSDKEKAEQEAAKKELDETRKQFSTLVRKVHGSEKIKDKDERKKAQEQVSKLSKRMQELYDKVPREYENHGWVWLFLRKPAAAAAAAN